jgi:hypothetical protein
VRVRLSACLRISVWLSVFCAFCADGSDSDAAPPLESDSDARHALFDALLALSKTIGGVSRLRELKLVGASPPERGAQL